MRVDAIAVQLRPRPMAEAADLGTMLVRTHARSIWRTFTPVFLLMVALALATVEIASWLPAVLIFWLKPWMDRVLLFVLSRAVFGEPTSFADLWQARSAVLWTGWLDALTVQRISPWRAYTQAIGQLEGQRGKARRLRRNQLLKGKRGAAFGAQWVFSSMEMVFSAGVIGVAVLFAPEGSRSDVFGWLGNDGMLAQGVLAALYACIVLALEPFFVAAGFAMYLNRRVELEAWDIEQEFRRAFAR